MTTVSVGGLSPPLSLAGRRTIARFVIGSVRLTATLALWIALGLLTGIALAIAAPKLLGGGSLTVVSGSMEPAIHTGDIVLTERIAPLEARVGDVITFKSPEHDDRLVTHRIREITVEGNEVSFVTKGDAVNALERWSVPIDGTIARPKFRLWKLGYPLFWLGHPLGRLALYVVPTLLIGGFVLLSIWRPKPAEQTADADRPLMLDEPEVPEMQGVAVKEASEAVGEAVVFPRNEPAVGEAVAVPTNEPRTVEPTFPPGSAFVILPALALLAFALFRVLRPILGGFR
jgi:signal peptidase